MVGKPGRSGRKSIGGQALTGRERKRRYRQRKRQRLYETWAAEDPQPAAIWRQLLGVNSG